LPCRLSIKHQNKAPQCGAFVFCVSSSAYQALLVFVGAAQAAIKGYRVTCSNRHVRGH
jgi:hypothetical protein